MDAQHEPAGQAQRGVKFWLTFSSVCIPLFLSAFDLTGVSTALPTIAHDLHGDDFVWIGSAYALASAAFLPMCGGFAEIFGRRVAMLGALLIFILGSALCGAAQTMEWLIAARVVQGLGAGGLLSIPNIIVSDLVPLSERGTFLGILGLVWALASAISPLVAGALASHGQWRWFFYLNVPLSSIAFVMVLFLVSLPTPSMPLREKLRRIDWIGNTLLIASTSSVVIALTWGGVTHPWSSAQVLVPLVVGIFGFGISIWYESRYPADPIIPWTLLRNRTSVSGYIQAFINPVVNIAIVYYLPVYFQACKDASPLGSSVESLQVALCLSLFAAVAGVTVTKSQRYRPQLWFAWCIFIIGMGFFAAVRADTAKAVSIGLSALMAVGSGVMYSVVYFPVLSPLPVSDNAAALSFHAFCRSFAGVWGVSIGASVLQNQLATRLPTAFLQQFANGTSDVSHVNLAYAAIPLIRALPEPLKAEVRQAFSEALAVIWQTMIGILGIGFLASLFMKGVPLHNYVDEKWDAQSRQSEGAGGAGQREEIKAV